MAVELYGYQFSVYSWIARLALEEKGVDYHWIEVDPFVQSVPVSYLALHPFNRVPTLVHDSFQLYETGAITRYIDEAFPGPSLRPTDACSLGQSRREGKTRGHNDCFFRGTSHCDWRFGKV